MARMNTKQESAPQSVDLTSVLARLDALETENQKLKAQVNPVNKFAKSKEKYQGPWEYTCKLWGGTPVLSYTSIRKDKTKDFTYKNHLGVLINNHFLVLKLADGSQTEVDVNEFNLNCTKSEPYMAEPITDGVSVTGYKFNMEPFGEFIVSSNLIN